MKNEVRGRRGFFLSHSLVLSRSLLFLLFLLFFSFSRLHARRAVPAGPARRVVEVLDLEDLRGGDALEDQLRDAVAGFHCFDIFGVFWVFFYFFGICFPVFFLFRERLKGWRAASRE